MRVLVIGAGVIGVAVADALAARGAKVTVLDMRGPGRGASFASAGILELRRAILEKARTANQIPVASSSETIVTNGGMHGLYLIFACMLEPGDEVIIPDPMWTEIAENIRLAGGVVVPGTEAAAAARRAASRAVEKG